MWYHGIERYEETQCLTLAVAHFLYLPFNRYSDRTDERDLTSYRITPNFHSIKFS